MCQVLESLMKMVNVCNAPLIKLGQRKILMK